MSDVGCVAAILDPVSVGWINLEYFISPDVFPIYAGHEVSECWMHVAMVTDSLRSFISNDIRLLDPTAAFQKWLRYTLSF